jgi:hypothetical protein
MKTNPKSYIPGISISKINYSNNNDTNGNDDENHNNDNNDDDDDMNKYLWNFGTSYLVKCRGDRY